MVKPHTWQDEHNETRKIVKNQILISFVIGEESVLCEFCFYTVYYKWCIDFYREHLDLSIRRELQIDGR